MFHVRLHVFLKKHVFYFPKAKLCKYTFDWCNCDLFYTLCIQKK